MCGMCVHKGGIYTKVVEKDPVRNQVITLNNAVETGWILTFTFISDVPKYKAPMPRWSDFTFESDKNSFLRCCDHKWLLLATFAAQDGGAGPVVCRTAITG